MQRILVLPPRVNLGTAVMAFSIDSASDMQLCPRKLLVKVWTVQITATSWRTPWSHCFKNTSLMTFTVLMKPAFLQGAGQQNFCLLEMKVCKAQNTSTPKTAQVCCYAQTWLAQTNFHPYWLARLQDPMPWGGKELAWASFKSATTTAAMGGWLQLSWNIGLDKWNERLARQQWHIFLLIGQHPFPHNKRVFQHQHWVFATKYHIKSTSTRSGHNACLQDAVLHYP